MHKLYFLHIATLALIVCLPGCHPQTSAPAEVEAHTPTQGMPHLLAAPLLDGARPLKFGQVSKRAVPIHSGHYVRAGNGFLLTLSLAVPTDRVVNLTVEGANLPPTTLKPGKWHRLQMLADSDRVTLNFDGDTLLLAQPHLYDSRGDRAPSVLLISVDTLRADYFDAAHMPRTFALFEKGKILNGAYTPATWTLPAHTSLLSGLYPVAHGVRTPDLRVDERVTTLAEHLREIGYYTAAFTEGNFVSASFGLDQGFHHYHENPPTILGDRVEDVSKLAGTVAALKAHQKDLGPMPGFYFLHTYEVHSPYMPHGELTDPEGLGHTQWLLDNDGKNLRPSQLEQLKALYGGEVAYTDGVLAELIKDLLAEGNWLVALTSDHGEEFGEHGGLLHADTVYEETAAIPLAFVGAGVDPGLEAPARSSLVDVAPTLLGLLNLPIPDDFQGRHLFAANVAERAVFSESFYFSVHLPVEDPMVLGVWRDAHKLIHYRNFGKDNIALYHLPDDPAEKNNLQQEDVRTRNALFALLKSYLKLEPRDAARVEELSQEQIETMRSLGYLK